MSADRNLYPLNRRALPGTTAAKEEECGAAAPRRPRATAEASRLESVQPCRRTGYKSAGINLHPCGALHIHSWKCGFPRSPIDSCTPLLREAQAELTGEQQKSTHRSEDTTASDYEVRQYEPAKWVATSVKSMDYDSAVSTGFMKLFDYIQGKNEKGMKIEMTAPVTCHVEPGAGPFCESTITVSFYIPSDHQADPPKPSESDSFIENRPEMTVFVRSFGGYSSATKNQEELLTLAENLKRDGKVFDEKVYYTAGYDSPFKLLNRHNEVWLIKRNGNPSNQE
ncbi:Heme-binding protein 2 [Chelonia mydas]|uniref:Heme-binding protein 2 n=1 Tax=Chelonia mydas TaxID=8469 RepID=M7BHQ4_CHEMY|nr:Heme-binding protein 2 [Chelonia mydas]